MNSKVKEKNQNIIANTMPISCTSIRAKGTKYKTSDAIYKIGDFNKRPKPLLKYKNSFIITPLDS